MKMEVNKELISYIKASELPKVSNPVSGDLIHAQGDNLSTTPISYFIDKINSGIYGRLTTSTVVPGSGYYKYDVAEAGTYTNVNPVITITRQELDENFVFVTVSNGVAEKLLSKKPNSEIENWTAKAFEKNRQVFYKSAIYEAVVDTQATDVPGEAPETVWALKLQGVLIVSGKKTLVQILDAAGNQIAKWDENGNFITNYDDNIIPESAVKGLAYKLQDFSKSLATLNDAVQFRYTSNRTGSGDNFLKYSLRSDVADFVDAEMKKYISVDETGMVYMSRLKVDNLRITSKEHEDPYEIFKGTKLVIPEQSIIYIDFVMGQLPTDNSELRTPTSQVAVLRDAKGKKIAVLNTTLSIQGNFTAGLAKKGYSIDLFNRDGKDVSLKIGDRPALKGFHLKSYYTDFTQTRDVGAGRLWQNFIRSNAYPYNHYKAISPVRKPNTLDFEQFSSEAQYALIGVPCEVRLAGRFEGLYTWRTKKTDSVYAINSKRETCISLESQGDVTGVVPVALGSYAYASFEEVSAAYEVRSPKAKNITQVTKDKTMRFFQWCRQVYSGTLNTQQVRDTQKDYINLPHWIDWIIISEFLIHWDSIHNNAGYISYDGDHFSPVLIDCDHTLDNDGNRSQFINGGMVITEDIFGKFKSIFLPEIKARYTELRKTGVLSNEAIRVIYGGISENIPWDIYVDDFKKWAIPGWWWTDRMVPSMDMIYDVASRRIKFLDSVWLNP